MFRLLFAISRALEVRALKQSTPKRRVDKEKANTTATCAKRLKTGSIVDFLAYTLSNRLVTAVTQQIACPRLEPFLYAFGH
jgi:hypothetical protein